MLQVALPRLRVKVLYDAASPSPSPSPNPNPNPNPNPTPKQVLYHAEQTEASREDNDWLLEPQVGLWPCVAGLIAKRE